MTTRVEPMSDDGSDFLHVLSESRYLDGECYSFAIALSRAFGWRIFGLMQGNVIRHALAEEPSGTLRDVRGAMQKDDPELGEPFGHAPPYDLQIIIEGDLNTHHPVYEHSILSARKLAETLWPELPWKESSLLRTVAFLDDLEKLSRKHGIWILSPPYPTARPVLAEGNDEDMGGYSLTRTDNGLAFIFDRYFREKT